MFLSLSRRCIPGLCGLLVLLSAVACTKPETVLREHPAQCLEVVAKGKGLTPEEARDLGARLASDLGLPAPVPGPVKEPVRVLRLTLAGGPDPAEGWGLGRTWMGDLGRGALFGAVAGSGGGHGFTSWQLTALGSGVGLVVGALQGPQTYLNNRATLKELGYLPWRMEAGWAVVDCDPDLGEQEVAESRPVALDLRPFLHPLPGAPDPRAAVRRANLEACVRDLARRLRPVLGGG